MPSGMTLVPKSVTGIVIVQTVLAFEPIEKRRRRDRVEHAYQRCRNARIDEKFRHDIEDRGIVVIETHNHATPYVDAMLSGRDARAQAGCRPWVARFGASWFLARTLRWVSRCQ